jgi:hypothetical protein
MNGVGSSNVRHAGKVLIVDEWSWAMDVRETSRCSSSRPRTQQQQGESQLAIRWVGHWTNCANLHEVCKGACTNCAAVRDLRFSRRTPSRSSSWQTVVARRLHYGNHAKTNQRASPSIVMRRDHDRWLHRKPDRRIRDRAERLGILFGDVATRRP